MQKQQIVYYSDELNDEFEGSDINPIKIDSSYKYIHKNFFWNITSFILYRLLATPFAYIYMKIKYGIKIENKKILKDFKDTGYFIYANHTHNMGDAFNPTIVNFPKKVYVVVHPNNVSIPFWGNIIKFLGPLPTPDDLDSGKNFINAISYYIKRKNVIVIYPEAHVWNYYTKIRPFKAHTFKYPIKENVPTFAVTTTYRKWKKNRPRIVIYIDGPFYADNSLDNKLKKEDLRNKVYNCMVNRSKNNNIEFIKYIKDGEKDD